MKLRQVRVTQGDFRRQPLGDFGRLLGIGLSVQAWTLHIPDSQKTEYFI